MPPARHRPDRSPSRRFPWVLAALLVACAGCTSSGESDAPAARPEEARGTSSSPTAGTSPAPQGGAPSEPGPATRPAPVAASAPAVDAASAETEAADAQLVLSLSAPARLAGVSAAISYDPARVAVGRVAAREGLTGFACESNARDGVLRIACAGLVGEERGGELAAFPVTARDGGSIAASDFRLLESDLVDDEAEPLADRELTLSLEE